MMMMMMMMMMSDEMRKTHFICLHHYGSLLVSVLTLLVGQLARVFGTLFLPTSLQHLPYSLSENV